MRKDTILQACRHALKPLARLLIRNGVTWAEFAEVGKQAYVEVARADYGLQGRPTNTARVALMTGLSRREVSRVKETLLGESAPAVAAKDRISHVLTGWHVDPDFTAADGGPAVLPKEGAARSLEALLKRYAGDTPHGALLKEMQNLGLVVATDGGFRVTARSYIRSAADPDLVRQAGIALHDHATTLVHNADLERQGPPRFERMATRRRLGPKTASAFQALLAQRGQAFLEEMDRWLAAREESEPVRKPIRLGVGMYLIHDDTRGNDDDE